MARLSGSSAEHEKRDDVQEISRLYTRQLACVGDSRASVERVIKFWMRSGQRRADVWRCASDRALTGDPLRLKRAMDRSEELIEEAIAHDPRLAHKPSWSRSEIGEFAEPSLVACGDDQPCFQRSRRNYSRSPAVGAPLRVVVSTDANEVGEDTPAAFIATARLVMQFRPLEIWWQGAWLLKNRPTYDPHGFVFHVPLIANDTDFSRLEFCIADTSRDSLSYCIGFKMAIDENVRFHEVAGQAERSYLENTDQFINHKGISGDGQSVAYAAANWIGMDAIYMVRWKESQDATAALQKMPDPVAQPKAMDAEEQKRNAEYWKRYNAEEEQRKREAEEKRMKAIAA